MARPQRHCAECGAPFAGSSRKLFCTPVCQVACKNRQITRGYALTGVAQAWRAGRHATTPADKAAASQAFRQLCRMLDRYTAEDAAAGRARPLRLYRARGAAGLTE